MTDLSHWYTLRIREEWTDSRKVVPQTPFPDTFVTITMSPAAAHASVDHVEAKTQT